MSRLYGPNVEKSKQKAEMRKLPSQHQIYRCIKKKSMYTQSAEIERSYYEMSLANGKLRRLNQSSKYTHYQTRKSK